MKCPECGALGALRLHRIRLDGQLSPLGYEEPMHARQDAEDSGGTVVPAVWCIVEQEWVG